ncbi:mucin-2-like [Bolinopsis microptera]|uniref:mucin-2-like n=1 Tax=Bolinopsis microptera TaxID=2820187 RepID=UPI00307A54F7
MKLLALTLLLFVCVLGIISAGKNRKRGRPGIVNILPGCEADGFDCTRENLKGCKGSSNIKELRQYCFAMKGHSRMMEELQDIFDGEEMNNRKPRMIEALDEGYESPVSITDGASCSIGGGAIMTFDGYSHSITAGPCTYALTLDRSISKLVVYGVFESYRGGKYANRLKEVAIYVDKTSFVLGEDFDINYQGIGYGAPARINKNMVVYQDEHYIYAVAEEFGAILRWDPAGQLKITVDSSYKNQVMGLCGMFNDDSSSAGEHNTLKHAFGKDDMSANDFGKAWALSGCYHEPSERIAERERSCEKDFFENLCSVTHAAPGMADCLRDKEAGARYQKECVTNLCLCDEIDSCMYTETLRISNDCYDRIGKKIDNADLRAYLNKIEIQSLLPRDHEDVPTEEIGPDDLTSNHGEPSAYNDFKAAASCYVYGHNHIQTFDGVNYQSDAHGCTYPLALRSGIQDFAVYGTFQAEASSGGLASHLVYVSFFDIKNRVRVQLGQGLEVNYEGRSVPLPYNREFVSIWHNSETNQIYIYDHDVGVLVRWDGESVVTISVDDRYHGNTKGLCGTYNGDDDDEINLLKDTRLTPDTFQVMVQEWKLPSCGFNADNYADPATCTPSLEDWSKCYVALTNVKFSFCVTDLPPINFIDRCKQDLCRCVNDEECKCEIVSAYASMCEDAIGNALAPWRSADFCPRDLCLFGNNGCKHTCTSPGVCSCDPGFALGTDGKSCLVVIEGYD